MDFRGRAKNPVEKTGSQQYNEKNTTAATTERTHKMEKTLLTSGIAAATLLVFVLLKFAVGPVKQALSQLFHRLFG